MSDAVIQENCTEKCEGFTGELWNAQHRKDLFICCVAGHIPNSHIFMPTPHAVEIGMECKFG